MQFTLVFPPAEGTDLSLAAVFTPCLVWKEGDRELLNPHPENPHYLPGDLQELFRRLPLHKRLDPQIRRMILITHPAGHGTPAYRDLLLADLKEMGFDPQPVEAG